jgi:predicted metal-dependent peptidase
VGDAELGSFLSEVKGMAEAFPQYELRLIQCDAAVSSSTVYSKDDPFEPTDFKITGRGGTSFQPVFEHLAEEARLNGQTERTPLIYFTDGAGDSPKEPDYPVLWCLVGTDKCSAAFGERLRIDRDELLNGD